MKALIPPLLTAALVAQPAYAADLTPERSAGDIALHQAAANYVSVDSSTWDAASTEVVGFLYHRLPQLFDNERRLLRWFNTNHRPYIYSDAWSNRYRDANEFERRRILQEFLQTVSRREQPLYIEHHHIVTIHPYDMQGGYFSLESEFMWQQAYPPPPNTVHRIELPNGWLDHRIRMSVNNMPDFRRLYLPMDHAETLRNALTQNAEALNDWHAGQQFHAIVHLVAHEAYWAGDVIEIPATVERAYLHFQGETVLNNPAAPMQGSTTYYGTVVCEHDPGNLVVMWQCSLGM